MKKLIMGSIAILILASNQGLADPIMDGVVNSYKAGWFPSANRSCAAVCEAVFAKAEGEIYDAPSISNKLTYDCKAEVTITSPIPGKGFLYGNNFQSPNYAPYCFVSTPSGGVMRMPKFYCLCVR